MKITYEIAMEIASHEAIVRQAYKDSVGVWTWSIGLTSATGHKVERYIGKPQSLTHCLRVYVWALENYSDDVDRAFAGRILTEAQKAAALSFHWNTGDILTATWVKEWLAGNIAAARKAFMLYKKPASIIPRREAERDLFFDGKWSNKGTCLEYTRVRASGTPDWSSAKVINIEKELKAALAGDVPAADKVITEQKVPVKLGEPEKPWYTSREVVVPIVTGGGITGAATLVEKFGSIPWQNLIIIVVAIAAAAVAYGLYARSKDKSKQDAKAEAIKAEG